MRWVNLHKSATASQLKIHYLCLNKSFQEMKSINRNSARSWDLLPADKHCAFHVLVSMMWNRLEQFAWIGGRHQQMRTGRLNSYAGKLPSNNRNSIAKLLLNWSFQLLLRPFAMTVQVHWQLFFFVRSLPHHICESRLWTSFSLRSPISQCKNVAVCWRERIKWFIWQSQDFINQ